MAPSPATKNRFCYWVRPTGTRPSSTTRARSTLPGRTTATLVSASGPITALAPLARLEGQVAFSTLARRFSTIDLVTDPPPYKENIVLRGVASLDVKLSVET